MSEKHWAKQQERGTAFFLTLTRWIVQYLPLPLIRFVTFWVVLYFYATSRQMRRNIAKYQQNLTAFFPDVRLPKAAVFRQFLAFGESITDRFAVWQKKIDYRDLVIEDPEHIHTEMNTNKRGQILLCSHLGNIEICRALVHQMENTDFKINVLVHSLHAESFNKALIKAGAEDLSLIQVTDLDLTKMLALSECIERGEWIAIAADRVPVRGDKTETITFLGKQANFPQGAWLLASLLKTPINTLFCIKQQGKYHLQLAKFSQGIEGKRKQRQKNIRLAMQQYANILEQKCKKYPLLWFNFYNFWQK